MYLERQLQEGKDKFFSLLLVAKLCITYASIGVL